MPMPHLTLTEPRDRFSDDVAVERWFVRKCGSEGVRSSSCASNDMRTRSTCKPQPCRCRACRRAFSVKTDTVMHGSNPGCRIRAIAIHRLTARPQGVSSRPAESGPGHLLQGRLAPVAPHPGGLPHGCGTVPGAGRGRRNLRGRPRAEQASGAETAHRTRYGRQDPDGRARDLRVQAHPPLAAPEPAVAGWGVGSGSGGSGRPWTGRE